MPVVAGIEVRKTKDRIYCDVNDIDLKLGARVICETEHGLEVGTVFEQERMVVKKSKGTGKIIRLLNFEDAKKLRENETKIKDATRVVIAQVEKQKLNMKLTCLEYTFDRGKLFVYYTTDTRIDFRELIKDLAHILKTRIQMVQIGVRDATQILGGLGPCGRTLCCCVYLREFQPCTMEIAKEQDIPINVAKLTGICGRLMCCLAYEWETYSDLRKRLPRPGSTVNLPEGKGKVKSVATLTGKITCELPDGQIKNYLWSELSENNR